MNLRDNINPDKHPYLLHMENLYKIYDKLNIDYCKPTIDKNFLEFIDIFRKHITDKYNIILSTSEIDLLMGHFISKNNKNIVSGFEEIIAKFGITRDEKLSAILWEIRKNELSNRKKQYQVEIDIINGLISD